MFCPSCGQEIPNESKFCMHCGFNIYASVTPTLAKPIEWEYKDFVRTWDTGKGGKFGVSSNYRNNTSARARVEAWDKIQRQMLTELQKDLDDGWQAITELGPSALEVQESGGFLEQAWELKEFRISLRRPKRA